MKGKCMINNATMGGNIIKRGTLSKLTYIISALFIITTIITLFIVHKEINNSFFYNFVKGYVILLFLCFLYFTYMTIVNMKTLKWVDIRKRLLKFIALFILAVASKYFIKNSFKSSKINFWEDYFSFALALSLSLSFFKLNCRVVFTSVIISLG